MDSITGTLIDYTANGGNGTHAGSGTTAGVVKFGSAATFDGNGYVTCGTAIPLAYGNVAFSMACWIKSTYKTAAHYIMGWTNPSDCYRGIFLYIDVNGYVNAAFGRGTAVSDRDTLTYAVDITDGLPHQIGLAAEGPDNDSNKVYLYVDGVVRASATRGSADCSENVAFYLGAISTSASLRYHGSLDEASCWSRALTAGEFEALYLAQRPLEPVGYTGNNIISAGDITVLGGLLTVGVAGTERGMLNLYRGSGTTNCAYASLQSANGDYTGYLWVDDYGKLAFKTSAPASGSAGTGKVLMATDGILTIGDDDTNTGRLIAKRGGINSGSIQLDAYWTSAKSTFLFIGNAGELRVTTSTPTTSGDGTAISLADHTHAYAALAFKTVTLNSLSSLVADAADDTLRINSGTGISLTADVENDGFTITNTKLGTLTKRYIPIPLPNPSWASGEYPEIAYTKVGPALAGIQPFGTSFVMPSDYNGEAVTLRVAYYVVAQPGTAIDWEYCLRCLGDGDSRTESLTYSDFATVPTSIDEDNIYIDFVTINAPTGLTANECCALNFQSDSTTSIYVMSISLEYTKA